MEFRIDSAILDRYPKTRVAWMTASVEVLPSHPHVEALKEQLSSRLEELGIVDGREASHPDIARWRQVYSDMGVKPSKYRSSIEALARRVAKGKGIWSVSSVVDCYDCISLLTMVPMGAFDWHRIEGDLEIRYGRKGEIFLPLGSDEEIEVEPEHIVYADAEKILSWLWNHRDSRLSCVGPQTRRALFVADVAFETQTTPPEEAMQLLAEHLKAIGGVPEQFGLLDVNEPSASIG